MYLLYALTRIRSIARNAGKTPEELLAYSKTNPIRLEHEAELKLAKIIIRCLDKKLFFQVSTRKSPYFSINYKNCV